MSRHLHRCATCHAVLYVCREPVQEDDCGRFCANAHQAEREYCDDCWARLEDDVNAAMHDDEQAATDAWHEGR